MLLLPIITALLPSTGMLYASNIFVTPNGVHEIKASSPIDNLPTFIGLKPSTSFVESIVLKASLMSKFSGIGL